MSWFSDAKARWVGMLSVVLALGLGAVHLDAEAAKRLGGGKSTGMQREAVPQKSNPSSPAQPGAPAQANPAAAPASAAAAAPAAASSRPGWLGPVAGLAAGLGLAALASHFGFGEELATLLMLGLLFVVVLAVVGFFLRRRAAANAGTGRGGMAYAGAGAGTGGMAGPWSGGTATAEPAPVSPQQPLHTAYTAHGASAGGSMIGAALQPSAANPQATWPAGFDAEGFARNAKVQFIRLQAAYDAGNLDDIREFTTPEMFAELRMDLAERGASSSHNDVTQLEAEVVDVVEEAHRYVVSVRFSGEMRDSQTREVEAFHELWHLTKPREGQSGWVLAGIQQLQ